MKTRGKIFILFLCVIVFNFFVLAYPVHANFEESTKTTVPAEEKSAVIPEIQEVLVVLETELDVQESGEGGIFIARTMDDVVAPVDTVLIPKESILVGKIIKVKKPGFIFKDAYIRISIDAVTMPSGKIFTLNAPFITNIYKPNSKKFNNKIMAKLPSSLASSGSSFILGQASSLAREAIWGISLGAGMIGGVISGLLMPDKNKTRTRTSAERALGSTPPMTFKSAISKGKNFRIEAGQFINIHFDSEAVRLLMNDVPKNKLISL